MRLTAAYQGRPGAYSELAAQQFLGEDVCLQCFDTFADVVRAVESGIVHRGVLPVHNTLAGVIEESCRLLDRAPVIVTDECALPIAHALIARPGTQLEQVRTVHSHPVALAQCRAFFLAHPGIMPVTGLDTAGAVETMMRGHDASVAAIAGAHAAAVYGAQVLRRELQDSSDNATRFVLFRKAGTSARPVGAGAK